jgi:putative ATPase
MDNLFSGLADKQQQEQAPLADRMRPRSFEDFVGQEESVGAESLLKRLIEADQIPSMILWGPPGSGKTSLAHIMAQKTRARFVQFSAVTGGLVELRKVLVDAEARRNFQNQRTILFLDEIHRWNKAQQDALLPHVERGNIILIGATTENPSFSVNAALLSRAKVFILKTLASEDVRRILERALADAERGLGGKGIGATSEALIFLADAANGDARVALNALDMAVKGITSTQITKEDISAALQRTHLLYDKEGEEHYNLISALHKSMRGSDPNASLYWLARILESGEDPKYVARRVVRFASEDIGLADPQALVQTMTAMQACEKIGMPECDVMLAQAVVYCAKAPKSNALYVAYGQAREDTHSLPLYSVPLHLRNAPTKLMKEWGYGKDYKYNPDYEKLVAQDYLPPEMKGKKYWGKG